MQYGFQRLVLLNSAGYSRAELPLDGSVSLVAPNNTGKTSLINALQYLLIIDRRRMDFGAHDVEKSRRFYFPSNSAYILLEVTLPELGSVVLGCVGKGVSYDYEYFAYVGQLNIEEYRLADGALVSQPQLASHLAGYQRRVFSYSSGEFANMLYGNRGRRVSGSPDFCVFRLEHAGDYQAYQTVLTRTLRLDKLHSAEVKQYLLQIFQRDLPDAHIDFKAEWDRVFAEVNAERAQYQAALRVKDKLQGLAAYHDERLALRGKLLVWRPLINDALAQWQQYYEASLQRLDAEKQQWGDQAKQLLQQRDVLVEQRPQLTQQLRAIHAQNEKCGELARRFALVPDRAHLEQLLAAHSAQRDDLMTRIALVNSRDKAAIQYDLRRAEQELMDLQQEMRTHSHSLYLQLQATLPAAQHQALARAFGKRLLTVAEQDYQLAPQLLGEALQGSTPQQLVMPGLQVNLANVPLQHEQRTRAELEALEASQHNAIQALNQQLETLQQLEALKQQCQQLERQMAELSTDLQAYDEYCRLRDEQALRASQADELAARSQQLEDEIVQLAASIEGMQQKQQRLEQERVQLLDNHKQVDVLRLRRQDSDEQFAYLDLLPHHPWLTPPVLQLDALVNHLQDYQQDCRRLIELDSKLADLLSTIHASGLNKYQLLGSPEDEIQRLISFGQQLPQEQEALERKARAAVVNIALCLRDLRQGLDAFQRRMHEFNRKINGRQLSDLETFKIETEQETQLVEAMDLLISTASNVESGESFELFNQSSMLDDEQLNRAKNLLIAEGDARQGLRVEDLFRLRFWVGKKGQPAEAFDDLDSAASNGTVLMAKLVTGLAMLHLMQDPRRPIQGICYLDEALALDARNQRSLIDTAEEFGFSLIFASPAPLTTARYCVPIHQHQGKNHISEQSWQQLEPLEAV